MLCFYMSYISDSGAPEAPARESAQPHRGTASRKEKVRTLDHLQTARRTFNSSAGIVFTVQTNYLNSLRLEFRPTPHYGQHPQWSP